MRDFRSLQVWEKSHALTLDIYRATIGFPNTELYGLTSQIRRASSSIPANIAEGCGRDTEPDLRRFLQIAMGSASEIEYHLLLAHDLGLLETAMHSQLESQSTEVKRMLTSLIKKLKPDSR